MNFTNIKTYHNKIVQSEKSLMSTNGKSSDSRSTQDANYVRHLLTECDCEKTDNYTETTKEIGETGNCNHTFKDNVEDSSSDDHTSPNCINPIKRLCEMPSDSQNISVDYSDVNKKINCDNLFGLSLGCAQLSRADSPCNISCLNANKQSSDDKRDYLNKNVETSGGVQASILIGNKSPEMSYTVPCVPSSNEIIHDDSCQPLSNIFLNADEVQNKNVCSSGGSNNDSNKRSKLENQNGLVSLNSAPNHFSSSRASSQVFSVYDECSEYNEVSSLGLYKNKLYYLLFYRKLMTVVTHFQHTCTCNIFLYRIALN